MNVNVDVIKHVKLTAFGTKKMWKLCE